MSDKGTEAPIDERRQHPRLHLRASVELRNGRELVHLEVKNISLGGVLLTTVGCDIGDCLIGSNHELVIFDPQEEENYAWVVARVVRQEADALAFSWNDQQGASVEVGRLLERMQQKR